MKKAAFLLVTLAISLFFASCEGFFGTKTDPDFVDVPVFNDRQVAYVPIQPAIVGLDYPVDIVAGWDELIYAADGGSEEVIAYDQAGNEQGRFFVQGLKAIVQDRRLDILALGTRDTTINGTARTLPAIYRIDLSPSGMYGLQHAAVSNIITHPFYFKSSSPTANDEAVSFEGIALQADNKYYITRNGPSNSTNQFGGPDNAVLVFGADDIYLTPVFVSTNLGQFNNYFKQPKGIVTSVQPPQSPAVSQNGSFYITMSDPSTALRVQSIIFTETDFGSSYTVEPLFSGDTAKANGFLYEPNRFTQPVDVTFSGDGTNYLFVVDAERDSLYQFNALGYEGVNPPAGASSSKAILASFGGTGESLTQFREPRGVAYLDRIVYVADAGNGRILRFKLTTDFD